MISDDEALWVGYSMPDDLNAVSTPLVPVLVLKVDLVACS